jgi:hypothetical protein
MSPTAASASDIQLDASCSFIAFKPGFHEGEFESDHYYYTKPQVTRRSPKLCSRWYQGHRGIRMNNLSEPAASANRALLSFPASSKALPEELAADFAARKALPDCQIGKVTTTRRIQAPKHFDRSPGVANRLRGRFGPGGSTGRTVRHCSYRLKVNQSGRVKVVFL